MEPSVIVAIVSASIAVLSLCLSAYLGYILRNRRTPVSRDEDMRTRLYNLKHSIESTSLLTIPPHNEMWVRGFQSLEELRDKAVTCSGQLEIAPDGQVSRELKTAVHQIVEDIKGLYQYRDSYTLFAKGDQFLSLERVEQWRDFESAKHALSVLQDDC